MNTAIDEGYRSTYQKTMDDFDPIAFQKRSPALFKRWLRTGEGKRWARPQERGAKQRAARAAKHPKGHKKWADEDEDFVRRHWGELSLKQMGAQLQRTQRAVSARARHLALGPASAMHGAMSLTQFAKHSGFSDSTIKRCARKHGIRLQRALNSEGRTRGQRTRQRANIFAITRAQQQYLLQLLLA